MEVDEVLRSLGRHGTGVRGEKGNLDWIPDFIYPLTNKMGGLHVVVF